MSAAASATVIMTGYQVTEAPTRFGGTRRGRGWFVAIRHAYGQTLYAHLEAGSLLVQSGHAVVAGQAIANADSSGGVTGPHLHLEYARAGNVFRRTAEKIDADPCIRPTFVKIDPAGTFLFVDTDAFGPGQGDLAQAPSEFNLPATGAAPNDFVDVAGVGGFSAGSTFNDDIGGHIAVFATPSNAKLAPGPGSTVPSVQTSPSCGRQIPTDLPEDFSIFPDSPLMARIPSLATRIQFSTNDCFFRDNTDPNNDYGVAVRIWRPPS